jgi:hypothetical protein
MGRSLCRLGLSLVLLASAGGLAGVALGGGGNSAAAHGCQKSGFLALQAGNGSGFTNSGGCTSYAAQGGTLFQPVVSAPASVDSGSVVRPVGSGFHAKSPGMLAFAGDAGTGSVAQQTDANGGFTASTGVLFACSAGGTITETITYTDSTGVHASTQVTVNCTSGGAE